MMKFFKPVASNVGVFVWGSTVVGTTCTAVKIKNDEERCRRSEYHARAEVPPTNYFGYTPPRDTTTVAGDNSYRVICL